MTLKELRKRSGLTQAQVGEKLNVNQSAVSWWETGKWPPLRKYHKKLAKIYGVTVDELLAALDDRQAQAEGE